jgi:hypothetical protein
MEEASAFIVTIRSFTTPFASGCATEPVDKKQETTIREDERIFSFDSFDTTKTDLHYRYKKFSGLQAARTKGHVMPLGWKYAVPAWGGKTRHVDFAPEDRLCIRRELSSGVSDTF